MINLTKIRKTADEVWDTRKIDLPGDANTKMFLFKTKAENGERERVICEVIVDSFDKRRAEEVSKLLEQTPNMLGILLQIYFNIGDNDPDPTLRQIKANVRQVLEEMCITS